jgi:DNA-directed RNA polymerase specialized sigma24 family protein
LPSQGFLDDGEEDTREDQGTTAERESSSEEPTPRATKPDHEGRVDDAERIVHVRKKHDSAKGIVATANLATIYQREIFFQVDPATLDYLDGQDIQDQMPSSMYLELDLQPYMQYLPELEQEIFYLVFEKKKNQKDIAVLLNLSQPTISYRYRRVIDKLAYLMTLVSVDVRKMVDTLPLLKDHEKNILYDLFFYTHQEMVGKKHGVRQSSVKWIFIKVKKKLAVMEQEDPDTWFAHYALLCLLDRFMSIRVMH